MAIQVSSSRGNWWLFITGDPDLRVGVRTRDAPHESRALRNKLSQKSLALYLPNSNLRKTGQQHRLGNAACFRNKRQKVLGLLAGFTGFLHFGIKGFPPKNVAVVVVRKVPDMSRSPVRSSSQPILDPRFAAMNLKTPGLEVGSIIKAALHQLVIQPTPLPHTSSRWPSILWYPGNWFWACDEQ